MGLLNQYKIYENLTFNLEASYVHLMMDRSDSVWGLAETGGGGRGPAGRLEYQRTLYLRFLTDCRRFCGREPAAPPLWMQTLKCLHFNVEDRQPKSVVLAGLRCLQRRKILTDFV